MYSFTTAVQYIAQALTGRSLKRELALQGLVAPLAVTDMYLRGESPEYILAAALACTQVGE
jgi:hypothetical protein